MEAKNYYYLKDLNCEKPNVDQVLYILKKKKKTGTDEIVFTDFRSSEIENQDTYHINLIPTVKGSGKNVKSSFYILLEKKDAAGNIILNKKIGSPDIVRKGVYNYKIERIFCDKSGKNLIFVIEKMIEDDTGVSIRYMVEATKF